MRLVGKQLKQAIIALLLDNPKGLTIEEIRSRLSIEGQQHLDKRIRELNSEFELSRPRRGGKTYYVLGPVRTSPRDTQAISPKLRAEVLYVHGRRCQMCGRSPKRDGVTLHIDHKTPREWGGKTVFENLEPLCDACNLGKRDYFDTFDTEEMRTIVELSSVHERLAQILSMNLNKPLSSRFLRAIANTGGVQDDWHKRLRELRYTGMVIKVTKRTTAEGYVESFYTLVNKIRLPRNLTQWIRKYERDRATHNRPGQA